MSPRTSALVALATTALAVTGCGSSDKKDSGSASGGAAKTQTLDKATLAKSADAICVSYNAKIKAIGDPTTIAALSGFVAKLLPLAEQQSRELGALKPDAAVQAQWGSILKDYATLLAGTRQAAVLLKKKDTVAFQALTKRMSPISDASDKKLDALGAPHCGSHSGT